MNEEKLVEKVMSEIMKKSGGAMETAAAPETKNIVTRCCGLTEFVGTAIGRTIGLVIANIDEHLHQQMGLDERFRSIGILSARTGAGPQIFAADEAVKATNTEIIRIELPRDTEGGAGHGSLIIFGAEEVSDARRAIEVALGDLERTFGDVYGNPAGHLEFQYTARASLALQKAFNAPPGRAFGITVGAPAGIGVVMADTAVKSATVDVVGFATPAQGTSYSNEAILFVSGDSGAVRQAIIAARDVGKQMLEVLGGPAPSSTRPYI